MQFKIESLKYLPQCIPKLAQWHAEEWAHLNPAEYDLQARIADYEALATQDTYPIMFVAYNKQSPLGSARLIEHDMDTHLDLSPWLASLYVHPQFRRQGIAAALIKHIEHHARSINIQQLYLFTEDQQSFYTGLGWQVYANENYYAQEVTIMSKALD